MAADGHPSGIGYNGSPGGNNLFFGGNGGAEMHAGDLVADPRFANAGCADFRLQAGSPAIDAAASVPGVPAADLVNVARPEGAGYDIGAYEFASGRPPTPSGGGPIVGYAGKCLDDNQAGTADGNGIQLWQCNGTDAQRWTYSNGQLVGPGGKCLDVQWNNQANGTPVQLWTCNGTSAQKWQIVGQQLVSGGGFCLDVTNFGSDDGTPLQIWSCTGGPNQRWSGAPLGN